MSGAARSHAAAGSRRFLSHRSAIGVCQCYFVSGVDIACRAAIRSSSRRRAGPVHLDRTSVPHHAGRILSSCGRCCPPDTDPAEVFVVMEPTRNAWVPLAAWFRAPRRAASCWFPRSARADLRALLRQAHQDRPAGLAAAGPVADAAPGRSCMPEKGLGPGGALKRAARSCTRR